MRQRSDLPFTSQEYQRRLSAVRQRVADSELDALLVTGPENITYLSGYQTTGYYYLQVLVVPVEAEPFMVCRLLENSNVEARTWLEYSRPFQDVEEPTERLAEALCEFGLGQGRIGYDASCYFLRATEQEKLSDMLQDAQLVRAPGLVEAERVIKSEEEIALMRRAARATEAAMEAAVEAVGAGVSENEVAAALHRAMFSAGGEYPACPPFVASGPRCAIGHATWEGRTIERGEFVFLEIGGCVQRYHTAMMRTVFVGEPSDLAYQAEALVRTALETCIAAIRPGVRASEIDALGRAVLGGNTLGATQVTRSGYSIGLAYAPDWGEGHIFSLQPNNDRVLEKNMVFHLIPWIQIPGSQAVVGISETVRVTADGCEPLTRFDRKILVR
jgi:Xaa-Pro dipeptidase